MNILTIETTCDETAAAVVTDELAVLGSAVASQDELHERFQGVVPEIAARAHVDRILPIIELALQRSDLGIADIDAVAVAHTPGLAGSLLVGLSAAKSLCVALNVPLVAVDHLQAHVYACRIAAEKNVFPCIGFIVSGGHSNLYRCSTPIDFEYLGGTIDDAAGEAFDKVASMLQLGFPGGPAVSKHAALGDPEAIDLPRPFLNDKSRLDFSFSGLKTAVRYSIAGPGKVDFSQLTMSEQQVNDICASFQEAVVDCLVGKALLAVEQSDCTTLCVGGGVAANGRLRERLAEACSAADVELHIAPMSLCTDNAVMGAIAVERLKAGLTADLDLDIRPGLVRA